MQTAGSRIQEAGSSRQEAGIARRLVMSCLLLSASCLLSLASCALSFAQPGMPQPSSPLYGARPESGTVSTGLPKALKNVGLDQRLNECFRWSITVARCSARRF